MIRLALAIIIATIFVGSASAGHRHRNPPRVPYGLVAPSCTQLIPIYTPYGIEWRFVNNCR